MPLMFSPDDLRVMTELRHVFDPMERSNPGKVLPQPGACVEVAAPRRQAPIQSPLPTDIVAATTSSNLANRLDSIIGAGRGRAPIGDEGRGGGTAVGPPSSR